MPNPFGIEQVDVAGAINAYQSGQANRMRQMMLQQQMEEHRLTADRQSRFRDLLANAYGTEAGRAAGGANGTAAPAPSPLANVATAYGDIAPAVAPAAVPGALAAPPAAGMAPTPPLAPVAAPTALPASPMVTLPPHIAQQLIALDPEQASHVFSAFHQMNEEQAAASTRASQAIAREAQFMLTLPESAWQGELQNAAQRLVQAGVPVDQIQNFQLSRQNLEGVIAQSRDIEKLREEAQPHYRTVEGEVINDNLLGSGQDPVAFRSEFVRGPDGSMFRRADVSGATNQEQPPQAGEVRQTSRGPMRFRGGDYRNPANYEPVQGGAAQPNAPGTFPRQDGGAFDFRVNPTPGG